MRSGTENVPAIAGLGEAAEEIYENLDEKRAHLYGLKQRFIDGIEKAGRNPCKMERPERILHHISSASALKESEVKYYSHSLEDRGFMYLPVLPVLPIIMQANRRGSKTLRNIHLKENLLDSTLRFSFSVHTTEEEIDYALEVLGELLPVLKKYTRH